MEVTVTKSINVIFVTREDGIECMIAKVKNGYEVYVEGKFTGYRFRSVKKAIEYCKYDF